MGIREMTFQKVILLFFLVNLFMLSSPSLSSDCRHVSDQEKYYTRKSIETSRESIHNDESKKISQAIGYEFKDEKLLLQALTRFSAIIEGLQKPNIGHFQRLEFIGDRVLNLVISDILFDNNPKWQEGQLTTELSKFTHNKGPLASIAKTLRLGEFLIIGRGEELGNVRENTKVLSDAYEALIGAIWVDTNNNYTFIKSFIRKHFKSIGLIDFNDEYEKQIIKDGFMGMIKSIMEDTFPETYGEQRGRYISLEEGLRNMRLAKKATKPLSGLAAAFKKFSEHHSDDSDNDDNSQVF